MVVWHEEHEPTGRYRFTERKRLFRKPLVVKQIEIRATQYEGNAAGVDAEQTTIWRDERLEDKVYPA